MKSGFNFFKRWNLKGRDSKENGELFLFNTLTKKKEVFVPLTGLEVKMYNCGPTVYNYAHIGNLRAYVFTDILRRTLERDGYSVKQIINITDVGHLTGDTDIGDDKIEQGAKKEGKTAAQISEFYTKAFFDDLKKLNVETTRTTFPKATEHIKEQIDLISTLEKKGFTYKTSDGIYFDTSKFKEYGKLGNINLEGLDEGARIGINKEKRNPTDFALWKFSKQEEKRQQEWPTPWGVGFPGWHIECSAMSMKYLGETLDIHTGGIDHIPVHHNNEIAQSEAATGKQFSRFWLHNAFVNISGEKMAKSEGNFIRLQTLEDRRIDPLAYKYWLLTAHYRSPITFSYEALKGAETAFIKLVEHFNALPSGGTPSEDYSRKFKERINDDLDTPGAISLIWQLIKDKKVSDASKKSTISAFDKVLGLNIEKFGNEIAKKMADIPGEIKNLAEKREIARKEKNWNEADRIRDEITKMGYRLDDTDGGPIVSRL
jgi:cysteinyl-tRNA synthetase